MIKAVFDSNIYISALIKPTGTQALLIEKALMGECQIVISLEILNEIYRVLAYPRILKKLTATPEQIKRLFHHVSTHAFLVEIGQIIRAVESDPDDNIIVTTAVRGQADYIVSGNDHLLDLKKFRNIKIVNGRDFMDILENNKS